MDKKFNQPRLNRGQRGAISAGIAVLILVTSLIGVIAGYKAVQSPTRTTPKAETYTCTTIPSNQYPNRKCEDTSLGACITYGSWKYKCSGTQGPCASDAGVGVPFWCDGQLFHNMNSFGECTTQCKPSGVQPTATPGGGDQAGACFRLNVDFNYVIADNNFDHWVTFTNLKPFGFHIQLYRNGSHVAGMNNLGSVFTYFPGASGYNYSRIPANASTSFRGWGDCPGNYETTIACTTSVVNSQPSVSGSNCSCRNCGQAPPPTQPPVPTPTSSGGTGGVVATNTPIPTSVPTSTPVPTATTIPTATPTQIPGTGNISGTITFTGDIPQNTSVFLFSENGSIPLIRSQRSTVNYLINNVSTGTGKTVSLVKCKASVNSSCVAQLPSNTTIDCDSSYKQSIDTSYAVLRCGSLNVEENITIQGPHFVVNFPQNTSETFQQTSSSNPLAAGFQQVVNWIKPKSVQEQKPTSISGKVKVNNSTGVEIDSVAVLLYTNKDDQEPLKANAISGEYSFENLEGDQYIVKAWVRDVNGKWYQNKSCTPTGDPYDCVVKPGEKKNLEVDIGAQGLRAVFIRTQSTSQNIVQTVGNFVNNLPVVGPIIQMFLISAF